MNNPAMKGFMRYKIKKTSPILTEPQAAHWVELTSFSFNLYSDTKTLT
jgi:hypothetical protein